MVTPRRGIRSHKLPDPSSLITSLSSNDVLLGRGSPIIKFEGNISFRQIVRHRKPEYTATGQHKVKDRIAHEIHAAIQDRGGRFLRRLDSTELSKLGLAVNSKLWAIVEHTVAMEKVKQALRDREPAPKSAEAIHDLRNDLTNNTTVLQQQQPNSIMWQEALRMANDSPPSSYGIQQQQPLIRVGGNSSENQQRMLAALLQQESMRQKARMMNQWMLMKGLMNINNNGTATMNNYNGLLPAGTISPLSLLQPNPTTTTTATNSTPLERLFATGSVEEGPQQQRNVVDRVV